MDRPTASVVPVEVQVTGPHSDDIARYAQDRIHTVLQHTDAPRCTRRSASPTTRIPPSNGR